MAIMSPADSFTGPTPKRKKTGSRSRLAQRFFEDLYEVWEEQGESALARAMFHDPVAVIQVVARLMPQKIEFSTPIDGMTDERLADLIELADRMAERKAALAGDPASRMIDVTPLSQGKKAFLENSLEGGGGGSKGRMGVEGENTPNTIRDAPAKSTEETPNGLASSTHNPLRAEADDAHNAEQPNELSVSEAILPYPVGPSGPPASAVAEARNKAKLVDPEDLF